LALSSNQSINIEITAEVAVKLQSVNKYINYCSSWRLTAINQ
jgi:hypothetical protein